jgi:uncharacterized protein
MDMSEVEGAIMQEHFTYWAGIIATRTAVVYGPVMDPQGAYGIAVLEVQDEDSARNIAENDPAIRSNAGFRFEIHQMPDTVVRQ